MDLCKREPGGGTDLIEAAAAAPTPMLLIDLALVENQVRALRAALPEARILYAVKANPQPEVLSRLVELGCGFDIASPGELERCLSAGANPGSISYGNTIKKETHIAAAYQAGIGLYAVDSGMELAKLGRAAPGARIFCRLAVSGSGAEWPLPILRSP